MPSRYDRPPHNTRNKLRAIHTGVSPHVIRFAFAGRCSAEDLQDPEASMN
jgi:hypothetical protein